tara:strand:+ start:3472 stop:3993 length:522 start_codon:yes stop_codon:yes gene_type:complete
MKNFILLPILIYLHLNTTNVFAQADTTHKYQDDIVFMLEKYFAEVDKKNIDGMFEYFAWPMPLTTHHNQGKVYFMKSREDFDEVFNLWKESPNSNFHRTELERVIVTEIFKDNLFWNVADVIYSRYNDDNKFLTKQRVTYYIRKTPKKGLLGLFKKWIWDWKIYMISNIEMEE